MVGRVIRFFVTIVRIAWPIIRLTLLLMWRFVVMSVASLWVGVPTSADRIAVMWTSPMMGVRQLVHHEHVVYSIMKIMAVVVMVMGWIIAAYVIVATLTIMQGLL